MTSSVLLLLALLPALAFATLGEPEASIGNDLKRMQAQHESKTQNGLTVHVLNTPGVQVKEFLDASGVVFAVSWRGAIKPDLQNLFGSYFSEYSTADSASASQKRVARQPFKALETSRLIVQRSGHMRDLKGLAYIKERLPAGVRPEDLK